MVKFDTNEIDLLYLFIFSGGGVIIDRNHILLRRLYTHLCVNLEKKENRALLQYVTL